MVDKDFPNRELEKTYPEWLKGETNRLEWNGEYFGAIWDVEDMPATHWAKKGSGPAEFLNSQVSTDGKLGAGSYFLTGELGAGKHVNSLMETGQEIPVLVSGKLLVVKADHQEDAATVLGSKLGLDYSGGIQLLVKEKLKARRNRIGDTIVDGVLMKDGENGELVIFEPEGKVIINSSDK